MAADKNGVRHHPENNGRAEMMRQNKKVLLAAVEQYGGNTKAMKAAGISKQTFIHTLGMIQNLKKTWSTQN